MTLHDLQQAPPILGYWEVGPQLQQHIYRRSLAAFARGDAARDALRTRAALARRRALMRRLFLRNLGGLPPRTPLNARCVGAVTGRGFTIEKIIFESRPQTFVTANLYLPDGRQGRQGAVLFVSGHHGEAKHVDQYQMVCQTLVQAGLIVFAPDPIGQGERFSYQKLGEKHPRVTWGCCEHDHAGLQCLALGDGLARYFVHDAQRGLDYLVSRPEVDPQRIGVTGNSGGGTQTSMLMLAEPRLAAAAPGTFIMNRESYLSTGQPQDAEQIWPGLTAAGFDHEDILLAMCPKPVRVLAVQSDFFPIEGTRRTVARCQRLWRLAGQPANLDLVEDTTAHNYTPLLARAAADFFSRHLLNRPPARRQAPIKVFPSTKLWCTKSGQVRGEIRGARAVREENVDRLAALIAGRKPAPAAALTWLRQRVFAHRRPIPLNPRFIQDETLDGLAMRSAFWWSQEGLINAGWLFRQPRHKGRRLPVTIALWDDGSTRLAAHWNWIRAECRAGRAVFVLEVTGAGSLRPTPINAVPPQEFYGTMHKLACDLLWLDDDLVALRAFDLTRACDFLATLPDVVSRGIRCRALGRHGVYAQFAAALDRRLSALTLEGGCRSYAEFVRARDYDHTEMHATILRGLLQHCDLPDLRRWIVARGGQVTVS